MVAAGLHTDDEGIDSGAVVDYNGNPVDQSKTGGWLGAGLILGTELAERVCVMGISMNLVTYLVGDLHLSTSESANIVTNFMGALNLLALLGGFLADAKLGRYMTVAIFSVITAAGVSLLTMATSLSSMRPPACDSVRVAHHECVAASGDQLAMLFVSLYTIALGAGGIKANVSGFGSDQFDNRDPKEEKAMIFFFNRFYFCISLGSLFAVTVLVYIQDNVARGWGYGISAGTMVAAVVVLLSGTRLYRYRRPQGSPLTVIWRVLFAAWRKRSVPLPAHPSQLNEYSSAKVAHTERFRCLDKAAVNEEFKTSSSSSSDKEVEDCSKIAASGCCTVTQVEEVKMVLKLLPIWSTCILFWTVYSQMTTFSVEQATYMNRHIGRSFLYPSGSLSFFLFISILLFTSLNEKLLVPLARTLTGRPHGVTSLQRAGVGLVLSILAMVVSALVEKYRRDSAPTEIISVFWLVPQFFLVGAGEAFAYVGQLEFFIREAPERMKSMSTGLFLSTLSMGFFFSSLLVSLVDKATDGGWIKNNLDKGRLDYFYWMLAVLGVINFAVFLLFASRHEYKVQNFSSEMKQGTTTKELESWKDDVSVDEQIKGMDV
ncbi:protein NRT1/ PTR FAMILY 6.4 [Canna indica]|uniref:Protein NRT1/ PTR FAMILY 6.4 n=1 Tax=Canna indica TaxID=4628 RepID=A0AAQ3L335_9LILI|nr:protein NRT1/ PTR FAMILY 6.4 [Canna indica]